MDVLWAVLGGLFGMALGVILLWLLGALRDNDKTLTRVTDQILVVYRCRLCQGWHVGHAPDKDST